ncbi:MAG: hypothetical protein WAK82_29760 [Streptosporangiaceae bacterium]
MKRSGQDARRPPEAVHPAGGNGPTRQSKAAELEAQAVLRLIGVAVLLRLLQSRRFWERLAVGAIVLGALGRIGQDNRAGTMARLVAWNKRQAEHFQRQAERQGKRLVRKAKGPLASKTEALSRDHWAGPGSVEAVTSGKVRDSWLHGRHTPKSGA